MKSLREKAIHCYQRLSWYKKFQKANIDKLEAFAREIRDETLDAVANKMEPHHPNCQNWECGNCVRAAMIRGLKELNA